MNVEHLLEVFTSIDPNSKNVWDACTGFTCHLYWHKPRLITLGSKIEALPGNHPSKAECLENLSWLLNRAGNRVERKRILTHALKFQREWGDDKEVARTLKSLSDTNRLVGLRKEGIQQAKEASEIFERLGDTVGQAWSLITLAWVLYGDRQLGAAEEAASRGIDLLPERGQQILVCRGHRILGDIHRSKREKEKAIHHFEVALGIASSLDLVHQLFWVHFRLAALFSEEGRLDDAYAHAEHAKSHTVNDPYNLARVMGLQASYLVKQHRSKEAKSEALHALDLFEKIGATDDVEETRRLLRQINARGNWRSGYI